jgi:hypothetical protein
VGLSRANIDYIVDIAIAEAFKRPPPVDYEQWAVNNISFSGRESDFAGPYNPNRFKPFTEIYRARSPIDPCRTVTLSKGAQIGGTVIATVFCLGSLDLDPGVPSYAPNGKGRTSLQIPRLLVRSSSSLPSEEFWRGVMPSQAANSRPDRNRLGSLTVRARCIISTAC